VTIESARPPRNPSATGPPLSEAQRPDLALVGLAGVTALLSAIQVLTIGMGLAGVRLDRPRAVAALAVAVTVSVAFAGLLLRAGSASEASRPEPVGVRAVNVALGLLVAGVLVWALATWAQLWTIAAYREPVDWDGLFYHIPAMHEWARRGGVAFIPLPDIPFVNDPMGVELVSFFVSCLLGTSRLVDAGNLWFWPLGAAALAVLAGQLGARGIWRWLPGALLAGVPVFMHQSVTAYVDAGFATAVMAALAGGSLVLTRRAGPVWAFAALFGMSLGLVMGTKMIGLPFAGLIAIATLGALLVAHRPKTRQGWYGPIAATAGMALLVGGYWYLRNLLVTGNPLYPFQVSLGAHVVVPGWDAGTFSDMELPNFLRRYPSFARPLAAWIWRDGDLPNELTSGLGAVWIAGGLPACLYLWWAARRDASRATRLALALLTLVVVVLLLASPVPWRSRHTIWLHALGLPALAAVLSRAVGRWPDRPGHLIIVAVGAAAVALALRDSWGSLQHEWRTPKEAGVPTRSTEFVGTVDVFFRGLEQVPAGREVLAAPRIARGRWVSPEGAILGGVLALPLGRREITVLPPPSGDFRDPWLEATTRRDPTDREVAALQRMGIEWVIWEVAGGEAIPGALRKRVVEDHGYRYGGPGHQFHLLRLAPALAAGGSDAP
jgi:hypothetical protein